MKSIESPSESDCMNNDGPFGEITKLPPNRSGLPDLDYSDSPSSFVRACDSPELNDFLNSVRHVTLDKMLTNASLYYEEDIDKVKTNEWIIRRFMTHYKGDKLHCEDVDKTSDAIIKALQWKKKHKVREGNPSDFPREFYLIGLYRQAINPLGEFIIHCEASIYQRHSVITPHLKQLVLLMLERIDNELDGRRIVIFLDLSSVPLRNADIPLVYFLAMVALNCYRRIVKRCIVYEAPWYLSPFISMILAISPRYKSLLTKVDKSNLFSVLSPEEIPVSLGGKLDTKFDPPEGCISGKEYAEKHGISQKHLKECLQLYGFDDDDEHVD